MRSVSSTDVLNHLFQLHYRSLPVYLGHASPWTPYGEDGLVRAGQVIRRIADDQSRFAERIANRIVEQGGRVEQGNFPMVFTEWHMLSLRFLLKQLTKYQQTMVEAIDLCIDQLPEGSEDRSLAEEALGQARAHLEALEQCQ